MTRLVADIGGTNTRIAQLNADGSLQEPVHYLNAGFESFDEILAAFIAASGETPVRAALAVAGPVQDGEVYMTNLGWTISAARC